MLHFLPAVKIALKQVFWSILGQITLSLLFSGLIERSCLKHTKQKVKAIPVAKGMITALLMQPMSDLAKFCYLNLF